LNPATAIKVARITHKILKDDKKRYIIIIGLGSVFIITLSCFLLIFIVITNLSGMIGVTTGFKSGSASGIAKTEIPPELMSIYVNAQDKYGVSWAVLAGINKIETEFGQNVQVSSAGAIGWMQFMPSTWDKYKVDGNGDGICDPDNPWDAIYSAAKYLKACGFENDPSKAIYAYNHDWSYVNKALSYATTYSTDMIPTGNGAWPVPGHIHITSEFSYRTDPFTGAKTYHEGIDIDAPTGTPVVAATDGNITMAHWNGGYGNCIEVSNSRSMNVYGHLSDYAVHAGEDVKQGQVIGYVGSTGRSTGPHLHFGVYVNDSPCNPKEWLKVPSGNY